MKNEPCFRCGGTIDYTKGPYFLIEGHNYCTHCGREVNEERKDQLQKAMFQELYFGDEM